MPIDPTDAFRTHMAIKTKIHEACIMYDFMQELKFPAAVRGRFFDMKELNTDEKQEAAFRQVYPSFPYLVGIVPPGLSKKFAAIPNLVGGAGTLADVYDKFTARYAVVARDTVPIMLLRMPRLKNLYVASVTLRSEPLGFQITLPSGTGYFITIELLADFMRHTTGDFVRDWLQDAVSGSY